MYGKKKLFCLTVMAGANAVSTAVSPIKYMYFVRSSQLQLVDCWLECSSKS